MHPIPVILSTALALGGSIAIASDPFKADGLDSKAYGVLTASSNAQRVAGNWLEKVQHGGSEALYEVDLTQDRNNVYGRWSVQTSSSSSGCLVGALEKDAVHFRTCTTDGSLGTREMEAVCPDYHRDLNRFVSRGGKLAWEVWDERRRTWRTYVVLRRTEEKRSISWSEEECGAP